MKKTAKSLVALLFCFTLIFSTVVPSFAASVGKVSKVTVSAVTYEGATLSWPKVSKASGYQVELYNTAKKKWAQVGKDLGSKTTSLKLTKLKTGTTYKYRVHAFNKSIFGKYTYGAYSATVSVKPLPAKVASLKASAKSTSVTLSWGKVAGASGYQLQQYDAKKKAWKNVAKTSKNSATVSKLTINTSYKFRVAAYRTVSKKTYYGAYSSAVTAKTALAKVSSLKVSSIKPVSAKLTWKASSEASGYYIKQYDAKTKKYKSIKTVNAKTLTYTVSAVPNTSYKYCVAAYKTISKKNYSSADSSAVSFKTTVNGATNLVTSEGALTSVKLSWEKSSNAQGYYVQQLVSGKWKALSKVNSKTLSYTAAGLVPNTAYQFRVLSYYAVSGKNYYGAASNTVSYSSNLGAASDVKITSVEKGSVGLSWTGGENAVGYYVQQKNANGWNTVANVKSNSATVASLASGSDYSFRVVAYAGQYTAASGEVSVRTKTDVPSGLSAAEAKDENIYLVWNGKTGVAYRLNADGTLSGATDAEAAAAKSHSVTVKWNAVNGAESYNLYCNGKLEKNVAGTSYTKTDLEAGGSYSFTVEAVHGKNGAVLSSGQTSAVSYKAPTTYIFVNNFRVTDSGATDANGNSKFKMQWNYLDGTFNNHKYKLEKYNTEKQEWDVMVDGHAPAIFSTTSVKDSFDAKADIDGVYTTITWSSVKGADGYYIQYSNNGEDWMNVGEKISANQTSKKVILPPDNTLMVRVAATDGKIRISGYSGTDESKTLATKTYALVSYTSSMSNTLEVKTPSAGTLDKNNNVSKTLYTLKLIQAINNTKADNSKMTVSLNSQTKANIDKITIKGKIGILPVNSEFKDIEGLLNFINTFLPSGDKIDASDLTGDLEENVVINGTAENNYLEYYDSNNIKKGVYLNEVIAPYGQMAYLYEAEKVDDISKKISNIDAKPGANGTQTITLTIAPETVTNGNGETKVHNGITQGLEGFDIGSGETKLTVGATTITAVINANGTLDSLVANSPYSISSSFDESNSDNSINIGMQLSGTMTSNYKFVR